VSHVGQRFFCGVCVELQYFVVLGNKDHRGSFPDALLSAGFEGLGIDPVGRLRSLGATGCTLLIRNIARPLASERYRGTKCQQSSYNK
jgi:hypothetical protein